MFGIAVTTGCAAVIAYLDGKAVVVIQKAESNSSKTSFRGF